MANLLIVHDSDGSQFDALYSFPKKMTPARAQEIVDAAIVAVKNHSADGEYDYTDLDSALAGFGIKPFENIVHSGEVF